MKFKERIPNFVDSGRTPITFEGTLEDILNLDRHKLTAEDSRFVAFQFMPLSASNEEWKGLLMAIYDNGLLWFVMGKLSEKPDSLPIFTPPRRQGDPLPVRAINLNETAQKEIEEKINTKVKTEKLSGSKMRIFSEED